jgi:hypothetical protein
MENFANSFPVLRGLLGNTDEVRLALLSAAWTKAAGGPLERRTAIHQFSRGKLTIAVENKLWQRNLREYTTELLFKLNSLMGERTVETIEFEIVPGLFIGSTNVRTDTQPVDQPVELPSDLLRSLGKIENKELREQILATAVASAKRFRATK